MDTFIFCVNGVLPVTLVLFAGYGLRLVGVIDDELVKKGAHLCAKALLPVSIFNSIRTSDLTGSFDASLLLFILFSLIAETLLSVMITPRFVSGKPRQAAVAHAVFRTNVLILGFPLAVNLFGDEGSLYMSMILPVTVLYFNLAFIPALSPFDDRTDGRVRFGAMARKVVGNPLIIASLLGLLFHLLSIPVPVAIDQALSSVGGLGAGLALLLLGGQFRFSGLRENIKTAAWATTARLIAIPLLFTALAVLCGFRGAKLGTVFIVFGAPTATLTYVMAGSVGADEALAGQIVALSTAASALTMFAGVYLLRYFCLI